MHHPNNLISVIGNLGMLLQDMGKLEDVLPLLRRDLEGYERTLGADHTKTLTSANTLAVFFRNNSRLDEASRTLPASN